MNLYKLKKQSASWNPLDWFKKPENPEKKEDLEVTEGIKKISLDLSEVARINENIKTEISRLKFQSVGYINNASKNLGRFNIDKNIINKFINQINLLDSEDWSKSLLAIQQLVYLTQDSNIQNSFALNYLDDLIDNIDKIYNSFNSIYSKLTDIQNTVSSLSNKKTILGRENQYTPEGEKNYLAIHSPYDEFVDLQIALQKLYENPFSYKGLEYSKRLLSRLWDKLRYIERPLPDSIKEWIGKENTNRQGVPIEVNQNTNPSSATQAANPSVPNSSVPSAPSATTSTQVSATPSSSINVDSILENKTPEEIEELLNNLTQMIVSLGNSPEAQQLNNLRNEIAGHSVYNKKEEQTKPPTEESISPESDQYQQYKETDIEAVPAEHIDAYARQHRPDLIPQTTQLLELKREVNELQDDEKTDQYYIFKDELIKEKFTPEDIVQLLDSSKQNNIRNRIKRKNMSPIKKSSILKLNKIANFFDRIGLDELANIADNQIKTIILKEKKEV